MSMGRRRQKDKSLPPRFHIKGNACYHVGKPAWCPIKKKNVRAWTPIGSTSDMPAALEQWAKIERGLRPVTGTTFAALATKFRALLEHPTNPLRLKPSTTKEYLRQIRAEPPSTLLRAFGAMDWNAIDSTHVAAYLDEHPSPKSANREITLMSRMYRWAIRKGLAKHNPCLIEKNPEVARDRYPEDWEYVAIRNFCWSFDKWKSLAIAMDLSYLSGLREGDIIKLTRSPRDEWKIVEGKNETRVRFDATDELKAVLERARTLRSRVSTIHLITSTRCRPFTASGFKSAWRRMMNEALQQNIIQERFNFHDIRAKTATDLNEQNFNAQLALGHVDEAMTRKYIRSRKGRKITLLKPTFDIALDVENKEAGNGES